MKHRFWLALWGGLFIVCAGLGFIPEPAGAVKMLCLGLSLAFFVPPAVLLCTGQGVRLVRNLSALSLGLTLGLLVVNFLTVLASSFWGTALHYMLTIVSAPMVASGHWAMSLFLWACLLMASLKKDR